MDRERADRRVARTRRLLQEALVALILERGYEAITVQDVLDRADVGRATFYAHFPNKEALLLSLFDTLRVSLREAMGRVGVAQAAHIGEGMGMLLPLFAHAADNRPLYRALLRSRGGTVVLRYLQSTVAHPFHEHLRTVAVQRGAAPGEISLVVAAVVSALLGVLVWWLEEEAPYSPAEMERLLERLLAFGVNGALHMEH